MHINYIRYQLWSENDRNFNLGLCSKTEYKRKQEEIAQGKYDLLP